MQINRRLLFATVALALPLAAQPQWRTEGGPPGYVQAAAYDEARAELVVVAPDDTWVHDGNRWQRRPTPATLRNRSGVGLAYDAGRRRTVLFGGGSGSGSLGDTWEWDGDRWSMIRVDPSLATGESAMFYDRARQRCVRYSRGPVSGTSFWEWDGTAWTSIAQQLPTMASVVYDEANNLVWGHDDWQMYRFTGTTWTAVPNGLIPTNQWSTSVLAYDRGRQTVMLVVGTPLTVLMYDWNGSGFVARPVFSGPPARDEFRPVYDSSRQCMVIAGGYDSGHYVARMDLWEWAAGQWRLRDESPPLRSYLGTYSNVAYDAGRDRIVLFSPATSTLAPSIWEWDGHRWHQVVVPQPLPRGVVMQLVYDPLRQRIVMVGAGLGAPLSTWAYDGVNCTQLATAHSPPDRAGGEIVYDQARDRVLLFGSNLTNDTWLFDGVDWSQALPANSPGIESGHKLVYDAARQECVMFTVGAQTWTWNGVDWTRRTPAFAPQTRAAFGMTWDPTRQRVVLTGGANPNYQPSGFIVRPAGLYEWDGSNWSARTTVGLDARMSISLVHTAGGLVMYGGGVWNQPSDLLVRLVDPPLAGTSNVGAGCAGSTGVPLLRSDFVPYLGHAAFGVRLASLPAQAPAVLGLDFQFGYQPLGGGCTLYLQNPACLLFAISDAGGVARVPLPVPKLAVFLGAHVFGQGAVLDPQGPFGGLAFTAGIDLLLAN